MPDQNQAESLPVEPKTPIKTKIAVGAFWIGSLAVPAGLTAFSMKFNWDLARLQMETAKLNHATALLNAGK